MKRTCLLLAAVLAALAAESGYSLFQKGLARERADADPRGAIKIFEQVVRENTRDRKLAAQALVRIAECYAKLGDLQSRQVYERILREFADQPDAAQTARARLAAPPANAPAGVANRQIWSGPGVDDSGSISADGRYLSFIHWATGDVAVRDLANGENRILTSHNWKTGAYPGQSVISPDNRSVAFAWFDEGNSIRIVPLAGGPARTVYQTPNDENVLEPFGWFPSGDRLLVVRRMADQRRFLATLRIADGSLQDIASAGSEYLYPALSPDGRFVAYRKQEAIHVIGVDGSGDTVVVPASAGGTRPVWTADGARILYRGARTGAPALWSVAVRDGKPAGAPELIRENTGRIRAIGITRAGALLYSLPGMANRTVQIAEFDAGASLAKAAAVAIETGRTANYAPEFSPDGRSIAYLHDAAGKDNLRIYDLASGAIRSVTTPFTPLSRFNAGPRWFPDGKSLLVLSPPKSAGPLFHRVDIATGKAELLHEAVNLSMSSYQLSPDGKSIYYCLQSGGRNEPGRILRYDLGAAAPVVLKDNGWFLTLALSPDGSQLAYLESDWKGNGSHIAVMPAGGGESRRLVRDERWMEGSRYNALTWSRDGRHILYVRTSMANGAPNVVWRVPAAGGAPALTGMSIPSRLRNPSFHPDGRRLLFSTQDIDSGEIWTLENFLPRPAR